MQPQATFLTRLDLSGQHITKQSISPLTDIMSIEFGIKELYLTNCGLEDDVTLLMLEGMVIHRYVLIGCKSIDAWSIRK